MCMIMLLIYLKNMSISNNNDNNDLYINDIKTVLEVGPGDYNSCKSKYFWESEVNVIIFEPNPLFYSELCFFCGKFKNVRIYNVSITNFTGCCDFIMFGQSSCVASAFSPLHLILSV